MEGLPYWVYGSGLGFRVLGLGFMVAGSFNQDHKEASSPIKTHKSSTSRVLKPGPINPFQQH